MHHQQLLHDYIPEELYLKKTLHSPSRLVVSAPLTLKEYTTPICSDSTIYCDVVFMLMKLFAEVTSTWYSITQRLSF